MNGNLFNQDIIVEVIFPDYPFGGVVVEIPGQTPIVIPIAPSGTQPPQAIALKK